MTGILGLQKAMEPRVEGRGRTEAPKTAMSCSPVGEGGLLLRVRGYLADSALVKLTPDPLLLLVEHYQSGSEQPPPSHHHN